MWQALLMASTADAEARLLRARMDVLADAIDDEIANLVIAKLLFLEHADASADMTLSINSPGGSITASLALCEVMHNVKGPVSTMCIGQASGTALLVLSAGAQGKRFALESARLSFVPLSGSPTAPAAEVDRLERALTCGFAQATGQSPSRIRRACRESESFSAQEAVRFGLIDDVMKRR